VEGYESEKEQIEALRKWWKANGKSIIAGVVLGVVLVVGGRWWLSYQNKQAEIVSELYEEVTQEIHKGDNETALKQGGRMLEVFAKSNYASLTALDLAKLKVDQSDLEGARYYLQWVIDHTSSDPLKDVARLRLARVLLAKGDEAGALQSVNAVDVKTFTFPAQELKGDILLAKGDRDAARAAYAAAADALPEGSDRGRIEMKLAAAGSKGAP
jgi:predicted negative regulator of RcsB-dependent stress response